MPDRHPVSYLTKNLLKPFTGFYLFKLNSFVLESLRYKFVLTFFVLALISAKAQQSVYSIANCNVSQSGYLIRGIQPDDPGETDIYPTQTIQVNVTQIGHYNIATNTVNGIQFSASGQFTATGVQNLTLNSSGLPVNYGENNYLVDGCSFQRYTYIPDRRYKDITTQNQDVSGSSQVTARHHRLIYKAFDSDQTGEEWLSSNLGAQYNNVSHPNFNPDALPTSIRDINAFGSLYQWGRYSDGHEIINWVSGTENINTGLNGTTNIISGSDTPTHNKMIIPLQDWRVPSNNDLWQGEAGKNNPCPVGFRVPIQSEFKIESDTYGMLTINDAYDSQFKMTAPGARRYLDGTFEDAPGRQVVYWTSSFPTAGSHDFHFAQDNVYEHSTSRAFAFSVRCILLSYKFEACDLDYDGAEDFNLNDIAAEIQVDYPGFGISFYNSFENAQAGTGNGLITGIFTAQTVNNPTILYARVQDANGHFMDGIKIKFFVYETPQASDPSPLFYCTTINSPIGLFNLTNVVDEILEDTTGLTFKYYRTLTGATEGGTTDQITSPASYSSQAGTVYIRIQNAKGCFIIREIPLVITQNHLVPRDLQIPLICADEETGTIDLTQYREELTDEDFASYNFEFYLNQSDAQAGNTTNSIQDPENFPVILGDNYTVYVRIVMGINCVPVISSINFTIGSVPEFTFDNPSPVCSGMSIQLTVETDTQNIVRWYGSETETEPIFTGNVFTPALPNVNITYWFEVESPGGCTSERQEVLIEVTESIDPIFDLDIQYCNAIGIITLPVESENGIIGTWFPAVIDTSVLGLQTYVFTPDEGQCAEEFSLEIEVTDVIEPLFDLAPEYCQSNEFIDLPTISGNGITGVWTPSQINTSVIGVQNFIFTPAEGQCADPVSFSAEVFENLNPEFDLIEEYCLDSTPQVLQDISDNGVPGTWLPAQIDTSVIGTETYTFTPDGTCAQTFIIEITISDSIIPTFDLEETYCLGIQPVALPTTSLNGVTGTWSADFIDTSAIGTQTYFFSADGCGQDISWVVTITDNILAQFDFPLEYCFNEEVQPLPTTSVNGITGTWNLPQIDTSIQGTSVYTFTPNQGQCSDPVYLTITVFPTPEMYIPETIAMCNGEIYTYEAPPGFDIYTWKDSQGNIISTEPVITFTQAGNYSLTVEINGMPCILTRNIEVVFDTTPVITDVKVQGNTITILATGSHPMEFSLNQIFWQSSPIFVNVEPGIYNVYARTENGCASQGKMLGVLGIPNIITPNGDGYNDYWEMRGIQGYPDAYIQIFDRYGKIFFQRKLDSDFKWDAKYNSQPLPSDTYWYIIHLGNGETLNGNITVKNY